MFAEWSSNFLKILKQYENTQWKKKTETHEIETPLYKEIWGAKILVIQNGAKLFYLLIQITTLSDYSWTFKNICLLLFYTIIYMSTMCHGVSVALEDNLWNGLSSSTMGVWTQGVRFGGKHLCLLSLLAASLQQILSFLHGSLKILSLESTQ